MRGFVLPPGYSEQSPEDLEREAGLLVALAAARRKIAELWPIERPAEEVQDADTKQATQLVATYRFPFRIHLRLNKVRVLTKDVFGLVIEEGSGLGELVD